MKDIHKPGRPKKHNSAFYKKIVKLYETNTTSEIAKKYGVSRVSVSNWLRTGRELIANEIKESE